MDRKTILAVVLSLAIYYAWLAMRTPPPKPGEPVPGAPETTAAAPAPPPPTPAEAALAALPPPPPDTVSVPFQACGISAGVSTDGGRLHSVTVLDSEGPYQVEPLWKHVWAAVVGKEAFLDWKPYGPDPGPEILLSDRAGGLATGAGPLNQTVMMSVVSSSPGHLELEGTSPDQITVHKTFTERKIEGGFCAIDVSVAYTNHGAAPYTGETWMAVRDHVTAATGRYDAKPEPEALVDGSLWYGGLNGAGCLGGVVRRKTQLSDTSGPVDAPGPVAWFGMANRYFGFYAVPQAGTTGALRLVRLGAGDDAIDGTVYASADPIAPGETRTQTFAVYAGPNSAKALEAVDPQLSRAIDLGFWAFFGYPLLFLLRLFHEWVGNWGLAIILLTVLVKVVTFPLTQRAFKATQRMQQLQPEIAKIKEQYADDPAELQRRTMALMSENGANPLSGCGPMFLQTPIWIALSTVILSSVDLYHRSFLYLKDLASPDPYMVLPLAITGLMWAQQQISQVNTANLDPAQQQTMKYMPLVMGLLFFAFPSGLAVYVFVNTLLSILQQWLIRRSSGTGAAPVAVATS